MSQFPGFAPFGGSGNADVGMADAEGDVANPNRNLTVEPPTPSITPSITRTADQFGKSLRISPRVSPPKLAIPNATKNYFAISAAIDPKFPALPASADDDMVNSSSGPGAPTGPPQVLPMTPIFCPDQEKPLAVAPPPAESLGVPPPLPMAPPVAPPPPGARGAGSTRSANYKDGESSSAAPPARDTGNSRGRQKVPLEKGYSQMVWLRLMQTQPDLAGLKGESPRRILTMEDVAKHSTEEEAWTVLRNRVYNVTPYLKFHPGGQDMLMKAAGSDGTVLFNKYHSWVNAEFLMEKCLVGIVDPEEQAAAQARAKAGAQAQAQSKGQSQAQADK